MKPNKKLADTAHKDYKKRLSEIEQLEEQQKQFWKKREKTQEDFEQLKTIGTELEWKTRERDCLARLIVKYIYGEEDNE